MQIEKIFSVKHKTFNGHSIFRHEFTDTGIIEWIQTDILERLLKKPQKSIRLKTPEITEIDLAWDAVEEILEDVKKTKHFYDFHHFCILEYIDSPLSYIQTVYYQPVGKWILERREVFHDGGYIHYKARLKSFPENKRFVDFETVKSAFRAFYYASSWPENFIWEKYNI